MKLRKILWVPAVMLGLGGVALAPAAAAHSSFHVSVRIGPPAPRFEVMPAARIGFVWAPGYWSWNGGGYIWIGGRWLPQRVGYVYVGPRWHHYNGGWRFEGSHWARDGHYRAPVRVAYRHGARTGYNHGYHRGYRQASRGHGYSHASHRGSHGRHDRGRSHRWH
ncbi:MAG TPA: hypothetical protein VFG73_06395 [Rhodanobacteraceae bacterium]|nr:hypothetical protein [Rhodanobacteraceae bacterium]